MTQSLDTFETSLLDELRRHVELRASRRTRRSRIRLAAVAAAAAVAAVATALVVPGLGSTPAYSVSTGNAGQVEVTVNRFEDAKGLEAALRAAGIAADINYVPHGGHCTRSGETVIDRPGISLTMGTEMFRIDVAAETIRSGETLVVDASLVALPDETDAHGVTTDHQFRVWINADIVAGPVTPCVASSGTPG